MINNAVRYKIISLPNELDLYNVESFKAKALELLSFLDLPLIIDMEHTTYLDSSGIGALLFVFSKMQAKKQKLCFINAQKTVFRVIALTGLNGVLPFENTKNDALSYLQIEEGP